MWRFECQEVGRALVAAGTVFTSGVVPELVSGGFGEEISFGGKDLSIEEFGLDGVMHTFDIGIGIGAGGRVEAVLGPKGLLDGKVKAHRPVVNGIAIEFAAQVSGDDDLGGVRRRFRRGKGCRGGLALLCYVESMIFGSNSVPQHGQQPISRTNHGCIACNACSHVAPEVFFGAQVNHRHKQIRYGSED